MINIGAQKGLPGSMQLAVQAKSGNEKDDPWLLVDEQGAFFALSLTASRRRVLRFNTASMRQP